MTEEKIYIVKNQGSEWHYMWAMLGIHPINNGLKGKPMSKNDPTVAYNKGEAWEYTVTGIQEGRMTHCFRHRNHPKTNQREYVLIPVSDGFTIEKDCDLSKKPSYQIKIIKK